MSSCSLWKVLFDKLLIYRSTLWRKIFIDAVGLLKQDQINSAGMACDKSLMLVVSPLEYIEHSALVSPVQGPPHTHFRYHCQKQRLFKASMEAIYPRYIFTARHDLGELWMHYRKGMALWISSDLTLNLDNTTWKLYDVRCVIILFVLLLKENRGLLHGWVFMKIN